MVVSSRLLAFTCPSPISCVAPRSWPRSGLPRNPPNVCASWWPPAPLLSGSIFLTATTASMRLASPRFVRCQRSWALSSASFKTCRVPKFVWAALPMGRSPWPRAISSPSHPGMWPAIRRLPPSPTHLWPMRWCQAVASCWMTVGWRWWSTASTSPSRPCSAASPLVECSLTTRGSISPMCSSQSVPSPRKTALIWPLG